MQKRSIRFKGFAALLTLFILSSTAAYAAPAKTAVHVQQNGNEIALENAPFADKGRIYLPLRELSGMLDLYTKWSDGTVYSTGINGRLQIDAKTKHATVSDGKTTRTLQADVQIKQGVTYVQLRAFSDAFGIPLDWDNRTNTANIRYDSQYLVAIAGMAADSENNVFWLNRKDGSLYKSGKVVPALIGKTRMEVKEIGGMHVDYLGNSQYIVSVLDNYGEPHLNDVHYKAIVNQNKIVRESKVHYWGFHNSQSVGGYGDNIAMIDDKTLHLVRPNGEIVQSYDLAALGGEDDVYTVEAIDTDFLLIRPYKKQTLTLVNLKTKQSTVLYKELLSEEEIGILEDWLPTEADYPGDKLTFVKKDGATLTFKHTALLNNTESNLTYELK
ncbi:hypothetical protein PAE9249_04325 [Paenibacillus sp. CECT 9249]|uniref:copper amine oxidase N-terminal domain-containing protein n=1 Tax=Paenibacillus sp. CECT 9249 TaxID=2845385 RepID=UPI001E35D1E5|nr:copper amine oxidase N-terminal domain-containing protein [Paenibacillus sp. CECT 9249]CAH0121791.1 hypothetical protein PAE9249_04325 [Paenibacillus sp. CECT 9249]